MSTVIVVQSPSSVRFFVTLWTAAHQLSLSLTTPPSSPKFMAMHQRCRPGTQLILRRPLLLPPSILPCIRGFSNESAVITYILKKKKTFMYQEAPPSFLKLIIIIIIGIPCKVGIRVKRLKKEKNPGKRSHNLHKRIHSV